MGDIWLAGNCFILIEGHQDSDEHKVSGKKKAKLGR